MEGRGGQLVDLSQWLLLVNRPHACLNMLSGFMIGDPKVLEHLIV